MFLPGEEGLVELLALPQPGESDRDVGEVVLPCEARHQVDDAHRLTHVEDVDLAAGGHPPFGLHDQAHGLLDGHEEAGGVRMGDGHRAAGPDLLGQDGEQGAAGAEDVAEADSGQDCVGPADSGAGLLMRRALHHDLGEPLGSAEDRRRIRRLVGGDQDEALGAVLHRGPHQIVGALGVRLDPSQGLRSSNGRCLCAAAWKTTSGRRSRKI